MTVFVEKKKLVTLSLLRSSEEAKVFVCQDIASPYKTYYTLWMVAGHRLAKQLIELFFASPAPIETFSFQGCSCFLFEYRTPRPVTEFFFSGVCSVTECGRMAEKIVMACAAARQIPFPVLQLLIEQDQMNLGEDGELYFTWCLWLQTLSVKTRESDCVTACAAYVLRLFWEYGKRLRGRMIIERKIERGSYEKFPELYRDIHLALTQKKTASVHVRLFSWFQRQKERFFPVLVTICLILGVFALATVISQAVFGDVAWFRIWLSTFEVIGTEKLG